jgi:membrane protease YdiL (CAAX protease family)
MAAPGNMDAGHIRNLLHRTVRITPSMAPHVAFWLVLISAALCLALAGMCTAWLWALGRLWSGHALLPQAKPRAVPWRTGSVLAVLVVWLVINIVVSLAYLGLTGAFHAHRKPTLTEQMVVVSLMNGLLLVAVPLTLRWTSRATLAALGLVRQDLGRQVAAGGVGFLLVAPPVYLVNWASVKIWQQHKHPLEQMVVAEPTAGIACLAFLSAVVLAPAAEELLFRGILQSWLAQVFRRRGPSSSLLHELSDAQVQAPPGTRLGEGEALSEPHAVLTLGSDGASPSRTGSDGASPSGTVAILSDAATVADPGEPDPGTRHESLAPVLLTSALFAAVHLPQWPAPIAIFFLSVGLGVVYQRTGSLIASFVMHALFNGFSTLLLFQAVLLGRSADLKTAPTATCVRIERSATAPPGQYLTADGVAPSKTFIQARFSVGAGSGRG